ncbi:MAG TPA: hypothetical protein VIK27_11750 [Candidatus Aquilonibacter sp.]
MNNHSEPTRCDVGKRTLVAAFPDRGHAHQAAKLLRTEGFREQWIGLTSAGATKVRSDDESLATKITRFFTGGSSASALAATLTQHGVSELDAERVQRRLEPNDVILTVDGSNHPELAARILEDCRGDVLAGESCVGAAAEWIPTLLADIFIASFYEDGAGRSGTKSRG